jgi:hypothetical protein
MRIAIVISIYRTIEKKTEHASISVYNSTQKKVVAFVQNTIDMQGLSHFSKVPVTGIEVRIRKGRTWGGKTIYFSFRGLSPTETKQLLLKYIV